jgi:hypothetical protein
MPRETDSLAMRDVILTQVDRLESIIEAAKRDSKDGNWGTYDALIDEFNSVRADLREHRSHAGWLGSIPEIETVWGELGTGALFREASGHLGRFRPAL